MEELIESISDYVRKPYTDYAIMINGNWGSGKTYFWNHKLRSRLETISVKNDPEKKYKTIYMSLYGINSLEEISKKIFIETNSSINKNLKKISDNREGNMIPEYVKTGLDMANLFGNVSLGSNKVDYSKMFSIDDKILCFDDLERANVDVVDILGYINNFVEHDGIKTIVICNEKELANKFKDTNKELKTLIASYILDKEEKLLDSKDNKPLANILDDKVADIFDKANAYERIKEKLIGETFEYIPEYSYILSGMIMKFNYNERLSDFFKRHTNVIISAFNKSGVKNLRILKHSLNDFEKIFDNIIKDYPDVSLDLLRTLLTFTIAVSFELKAGNVSKEKLMSISGNEEYSTAIFALKSLNETNQFYLKDFDNRYFINNNFGYKFFKFVEVYVRTRYFNNRMYKDNMQHALKFTVKEENTSNQSYKVLLDGSYLKMSDFDFNILVMQVLDAVKNGKIEFIDHVNLFAVYKYFIINKLLKLSISELKHAFILGMQISSIKYISNVECKNLTTEYEDKDVEEIRLEYNAIRIKALEEIAFNNANKLFSNIPNNIQEFYKLIITDYKNVPVFSKYDMKELYGKLDLTANYDLYNFINMLEVRYKDDEILFEKDKANLKKLSDLINKNNEKTERTIKSVLLDNIKDVIEKRLKTK